MAVKAFNLRAVLMLPIIISATSACSSRVRNESKGETTTDLISRAKNLGVTHANKAVIVWTGEDPLYIPRYNVSTKEELFFKHMNLVKTDLTDENGADISETLWQAYNEAYFERERIKKKEALEDEGPEDKEE